MKRRLGSGKSGAAEIKNHPFFKKLDWKKLSERKIKPPLQLDIKKDKLDVQVCMRACDVLHEAVKQKHAEKQQENERRDCSSFSN